MTTQKLWVDKFNPKTIDDCVLPPNLKERLLNIVESGNLPNLLLVGDAGMGKTTAAKCLCNQLELDVLEINASLNNGIDTIRDKVLGFAQTTALFGNYKVVLLDEADNLSSDAQKSLRGLIEQMQTHCRFILTANYGSQLISPLRSRFVTLNYKMDDRAAMERQMVERCRWMLEQESVTFSEDDDIATLVRDNYPNIRQVVHQLENASLDGTLRLQLQAEVAPLEALLAAMSDNNIRDIIAWVEAHTTAGRNGAALATLLTEAVIKHQPPTSIPNLVWVIATNEALPSTDNYRHCLNLALQTASEWG